MDYVFMVTMGLLLLKHLVIEGITQTKFDHPGKNSITGGWLLGHAAAHGAFTFVVLISFSPESNISYVLGGLDGLIHLAVSWTSATIIEKFRLNYVAYSRISSEPHPYARTAHLVPQGVFGKVPHGWDDVLVVKSVWYFVVVQMTQTIYHVNYLFISYVFMYID